MKSVYLLENKKMQDTCYIRSRIHAYTDVTGNNVIFRTKQSFMTFVSMIWILRFYLAKRPFFLLILIT